MFTLLCHFVLGMSLLIFILYSFGFYLHCHFYFLFSCLLLFLFSFYSYSYFYSYFYVTVIFNVILSSFILPFLFELFILLPFLYFYCDVHYTCTSDILILHRFILIFICILFLLLFLQDRLNALRCDHKRTLHLMTSK